MASGQRSKMPRGHVLMNARSKGATKPGCHEHSVTKSHIGLWIAYVIRVRVKSRLKCSAKYEIPDV